MEEVKVWLCENGFGDYGQNFEDNGWDDLTLLPDMTYAQMKKCIHKEGHVAKFRKAARQLKKDSNAGINDNRKLNTRPGKRTTEYPTEYRQPVASSPGSSLGDRLLSKFRKAARQLKKDSNAGINDNRKLNTRAGKRTTECPTENIQPDATSPGSSLGDSLLSNDATAKYSQGIEKPRKLNTLTKEGTEHEDGGNFDAGIINAASSCVYSST